MSRKTTDQHGIIIYYDDKSLIHREDGPAKIFSDGYKEWWLNGKCHREDGPAVEDDIDGPLYFIDDEELTEQEFVVRKLKNFLNEI